MAGRGECTDGGRAIRGTQQQFARLYSEFLDAVHRRPELILSIGDQIGDRNAVRILDCAAGIGFPSLDLAALARRDYEIHCSDGDPAMLAVLAERARALRVPLDDLTPRRSRPFDRPDGPDGLELDWRDLGRIEGQYDYVLCRGNSLIYDSTWTGSERVASRTLVEHHLRRMADRVRPGGFLHVDAPRSLELETRDYERHGSTMIIQEHVTVAAGSREWQVTFVPRNGDPAVTFRRYSSLLTIDDIGRVLENLGFEQTAPIDLPAERENFGVIIARKPRW